MSKKIIIISVALLIGYGAIITGIYVNEHRFDQSRKIYDIIEDSIIVLMGEYPDKPVSVLGRILQLLLFLTSILISGTIIGKISSVFIK